MSCLICAIIINMCYLVLCIWLARVKSVYVSIHCIRITMCGLQYKYSIVYSNDFQPWDRSLHGIVASMAYKAYRQYTYYTCCTLKH